MSPYSLDEVLAIHERLIEKFGGAQGIRDPGLLEGALFRPQTGYYEELVEMATALFESLILNHPLIDGNKRVAFFSFRYIFAAERLEVLCRRAKSSCVFDGPV